MYHRLICINVPAFSDYEGLPLQASLSAPLPQNVSENEQDLSANSDNVDQLTTALQLLHKAMTLLKNFGKFLGNSFHIV